MNIVLLNAILELSGGGEKLTLDMSRALEQLGYNVVIYTHYSSSDKIERMLSLLSPNYKPKIIAKRLPKWYGVPERITSGRFVRFWRLILAKRLLDEAKKESNFLIDMSSNAPTKADIAYIHFPSLLPSGKPGLHWKLYDRLIKWLGNRIYGEPKIILANSSWTVAKFKELYGDKFKILILYPCIDAEFFLEEAGKEKRDEMVITVSRFTPEKNLDKIIHVAKEMPDYSFYLVGTAGRYSEKVIEGLRVLINNLNVRNVSMLTNEPREKVRKLLSEATFYLHPPFPEHFGISVVEAVASGCIPIVYADGGAWTDIVSKIDLSLGYFDITEVPKIINDVMVKGRVREIREKALKIAKEFTFDKFKEKLKGIMQTI